MPFIDRATNVMVLVSSVLDSGCHDIQERDHSVDRLGLVFAGTESSLDLVVARYG